MFFCRFFGAFAIALSIMALLSACAHQQTERSATFQILTPKILPVAANNQQNFDSPLPKAFGNLKELSNSSGDCGCLDQSIALPDGTFVAPLSCRLPQSCRLQFNAPTYLHLKHRSNCHAVYDEYYVEAKTTVGEDENGQGVPTESLIIAWRANGARRDKECGTGSFCAYSDRVYGYCVTSLCSKAQAIINGQPVTIALEENCKVD